MLCSGRAGREVELVSRGSTGIKGLVVTGPVITGQKKQDQCRRKTPKKHPESGLLSEIRGAVAPCSGLVRVIVFPGCAVDSSKCFLKRHSRNQNGFLGLTETHPATE